MMVMSKPTVFSWLCMICRVSERRSLPVVDFTSKLAFWLPLAQMPSLPLAQPSPVMSEVIRSLSTGEYLAYGVE